MNLDDGIIYKPCLKCKSDNYDNFNAEKIKELPDGKLLVEPNGCDKCDLLFMKTENNYLH